MKLNPTDSHELYDTQSMKVRFYPTKAQEQQISVEIGCARAVWNWGRKLCKNQSLIDGKIVSYGALSRLITLMKKDDDFKWINNASDNVIRNSLRDLDTAYTNYFRNPKEVGKPNYKDKEWLGWEVKDFEASIDLGEVKPINSIGIDVLNAPASWIFPPKTIEYYTSEDGINYKKIDNYNIDAKQVEGSVLLSRTFTQLKARFIKLKAVSIGVCPKGHVGEGDKAWLFISEIEIK